jgi:hypothetical protein
MEEYLWRKMMGETPYAWLSVVFVLGLFAVVIW